MQNKHPYKLDFEQYVRNAEPAKKEKSYAWSTAIGLQQVDGLTPSKYLFDTARREIGCYESDRFCVQIDRRRGCFYKEVYFLNHYLNMLL